MGKNLNLISFEKTKELYNYLRGETKEFEGIKTHHKKLTPDQAFSIIYILQEAESFGFISDTFERCDECDELYNSDEEGDYLPSTLELLLDDYDELTKEQSDKIQKEIEEETGKKFHVCDCSKERYYITFEQTIKEKIKKYYPKLEEIYDLD